MYNESIFYQYNSFFGPPCSKSELTGTIQTRSILNGIQNATFQKLVSINGTDCDWWLKYNPKYQNTHNYYVSHETQFPVLFKWEGQGYITDVIFYEFDLKVSPSDFTIPAACN